jgi:hypothetical protein
LIVLPSRHACERGCGSAAAVPALAGPCSVRRSHAFNGRRMLERELS